MAFSNESRKDIKLDAGNKILSNYICHFKPGGSTKKWKFPHNCHEYSFFKVSIYFLSVLFATHLPEFIASLSSIESFAPSKASTPSHWMTDKVRKLCLLQNKMKSILVFLMKIKLITFTLVVRRSFGITFFCIGTIVLHIIVTLWFRTFCPVAKYQAAQPSKGSAAKVAI